MFGMTFHASNRFKERFPHLNINSELNSAVQFGKSVGNCKYYISSNKVVFAVSDNFCTTVLTESQAYNNMRINHYVTIQPKIKTKPVIKDIITNRPNNINTTATNTELAIALAKKHAIQDKIARVQPKITEQERIKELNVEADKLGIVIGRRTLSKYNNIYIQYYLAK